MRRRLSPRPYVNIPLAPNAIEVITREADAHGISKGAYVSMVILGQLAPSPPSTGRPCTTDASSPSAPLSTDEPALQVDDTAA